MDLKEWPMLESLFDSGMNNTTSDTSNSSLSQDLSSLGLLQEGEAVTDLAVGLLSGVGAMFATSLTVFFFLVFIILEASFLRGRIERAWPGQAFDTINVVGAQIEESVRLENRSYLSTVMGLAFRKLDVFGYYKFVTAVKNINLLPNRDSMMAQKKAKAFSNFAFKGVIGIVSIIYIILFGLSFWQITSLNSKVSNYDQIVQNHQLKEAEVNKFSKELGKLNKSLELSSSIKSNKKINFRVLAQIASAVPKRVRFIKIDYNGSDQIIIEGLAASDQDILKLISNLNNKKLITQASLASMMLPTSSGNNTRNMKGFIIACIIGAA